MKKKKIYFADINMLLIKHNILKSFSPNSAGHIINMAAAFESCYNKTINHGSFVTHCVNERWDSAIMVADHINVKAIPFYKDVVKLLKS